MSDDSLAIGQLHALSAAAVPVLTKATAAEAWLTFNRNLEGAPPERAASEWLDALEKRKAALLLPEYHERYRTAVLAGGEVTYERDGVTVPCRLTVFVSLVRERFLCISLWLSCPGPVVPMPTRLSSVFNDDDCHLPDWRSAAVGGPPARLKGSELSVVARDQVLGLFGGQIEPRMSPTATQSHFDATVATLCDLPEAFERDGDSDTDLDASDWRYRVAGLLPVIRSAAHTYRPSFLIESLGTDVMDVAAGHYFIGRRRILALVADEAGKEAPQLISNLVTWTELLSENAAVQLAAIRAHAGMLNAQVTRARSVGEAARALAQSQYLLYQDLDEAHNIAVSLDPVFWSHQETLKRVSGLSTLAANLRERSAALASTSALEEQRAFAAAAQALAIVIGALTFAASAVQVAAELHATVGVAAVATAGATVLGAMSGWGVVAVTTRVQQRTIRSIARRTDRSA